MQTPATRLLDDRGLAYEVHRYDHDPAAASYGMEAAELLGLDPDVVFKTLMARLDGDRGPLVVAIVPVAAMLDLKALARAAGAKRAAMAAVADAERATGYVAGGISPLGQKRPHATFIDETAEICDRVYVSGGQRGLDISVEPSALIELLDATVAPLAT
ncbi:MAG: Cys-tRNA(Pro) deacylase [Actinomycetota bacterium]